MNHQAPETKNWQIALFSLNGISSNTALTMMGYYMFFTQNILGLHFHTLTVLTPLVLFACIITQKHSMRSDGINAITRSSSHSGHTSPRLNMRKKHAVNDLVTCVVTCGALI